MELRNLGRTGLKVSPLCLGAMMFGGWGNPDHDDSIKIIHKAFDSGINFIDTADVYSQGESEEIVGKALSSIDRSSVVLATKVHGQMGENPLNQGNSRRWIMEEVEHSLKRLKTDYIDLYQIHRPDEATDIEETLGALSDLVHQGKIRYFGSSTFPAEQIVAAQWAADRRGYEHFRSEQPPYSILVRGIERDVLPTAQTYGMGVIPWSPLAGGWLAGKFGEGKKNTSRRSARLPDRYDIELPGNQRKLEAVDKLTALADEAGVTLIELAIAFVLEHPAVTSPIIGPRTMKHLDSQLSATEVHLSTDVLDRIDEINPPGTNVNPIDAGWAPSVLTNMRRRRRGDATSSPTTF
jgi:aryl-alcohol dehydrogenase-like predicted oxidoreductase